MTGGGVPRARIPASLRKTIQDIKEIAGKHSDEDIYAMLKECNMDPNETAQKLFFLDTFHEVKKKRDRKKLNVSDQASEHIRISSGMQRRGLRGYRENNSSGYFSNGTGGGKKRSSPTENGSTGRAPKSSGPVHRNINDDGVFGTSPSIEPGRPTNLISCSSILESIPHDTEGNTVDIVHGTPAAWVHKLAKQPTPPGVTVKQLQSLSPGISPAPMPTTTFTAASGASHEGSNSESSSREILISLPVSGVYSSASDPVLPSSLNSPNPGAAGTIKCETGIQRIVPALSNTSLPESISDGVSDDQDLETINSNRKTLQGVEEDHQSEPRRSSTLLKNHTTAAAASYQDGWSTKLANGSSNVINHTDATVSLQANMPSLPKVDDSVLGQATSQLNRKLEGLNLTSQGPVIFPDHIQVPEVYRNGLTFGSLNDSFRQDNGESEDAKLVDGIALANEDGTIGPSLRLESASATAHEGVCPGQSQFFPPMPENLPVLKVNVISPPAPPTYELSMPDIMPPIVGAPYPFLHIPPDHGFGILPPMLAPHLVQVEGTGVSSSSVSSTSDSSQPSTQTTVGAGQNSPAFSPPLFPYLRQPYPSNYYPYNPYFTQLYMTTNASQIFGHSGFAQEASTGNIYMPPPAADTGFNFPVPQLYKPGTAATNLSHFGIPSSYDSYVTSTLGYGIGAAMTPGSSSSTKDVTAHELKEKNMYPVLTQNEDSNGWSAAPARDLTSLQANFYYNYPHTGQGYLAGMYHLTPTAAAASAPSISQTPPPQHS